MQTGPVSSTPSPYAVQAAAGVFGIDLDGRCTFVNQAGAAMLGRRTEQVLGRDLHGLVHPEHLDGGTCSGADCPIFNALRRGLVWRVDSERLWRADGSAFDAECSTNPILDQGGVRGAVVIIGDGGERQRAEEALHQARAELAQLRRLSAYRDTTREDERRRIAHSIHDELGSLLVALKLDLNWLEKRVEDRPALQDKCTAMGTLIDSAVDKLGRVVTDLHPSILDHEGLWAALEWQAQEFIEASGLRHAVQVHVSAGVVPPRGEQGGRWAIAVFRIFQEMLNNVARHAGAQSVGIRLYVDGPPQPVLHLEVRDDGAGAEREAFTHPRSHGVTGMRERARHFGGDLMIDSVPGHGTLVRLTMPLPDERVAP